jgi:hypothetical protein
VIPWKHLGIEALEYLGKAVCGAITGYVLKKIGNSLVAFKKTLQGRSRPHTVSTVVLKKLHGQLPSIFPAKDYTNSPNLYFTTNFDVALSLALKKPNLPMTVI